MWKFCVLLWFIEFVTYDNMLLNVVLAIWYGRYVSLSPVLHLSSSVICFLCSFCLWMIWRSNAVRHIVSGLPAVQHLCGTSRALQQGCPPEILNVHRMCQAGSRKAFQWSLQGHYHYTQWAVGWWSLAQSGLYILYHMKTVALRPNLLCISISWQVFRLMAAVWIEPKTLWGIE